MSIQHILDTAQSIEINRMGLVASSMSRNGRLLTQSRSWVRPWQITVQPRSLWQYNLPETRAMIEAIHNTDKWAEQLVTLGNNAATRWIVQYNGQLDNNKLAELIVQVVDGNKITISVPQATTIASGTKLFAAGDVIQYAGVGADNRGYRYPYVVQTDVIYTAPQTPAATLIEFKVNRGHIIQTNFDPVGKNLRVGHAVYWTVKVAEMPTYRILPGKLVEFTGEFKLIESVV
jgi:hypothetical protein